MNSTNPTVQKAPQLALEHFFATMFESSEKATKIPISSDTTLAEKAKIVLGEALYSKFLNNWDVKPVHYKNDSGFFTKLQGLQSFIQHFKNYPQHFWEIVRVGANVQFQPVAKEFNENCSYRAEFLTMQFKETDCQWMQILSKWTGGGFKDYWFYTPPKSNSVPLHYDSQNNFIVQLHGTKKWRIYPLKQYNPVYGFARTPLQEGDFENEEPWDIELQPGDILLLPRGIPHKAWSNNDASLHLDLNLIVPAQINLAFLQLWLSINQQKTDKRWESFLPFNHIADKTVWTALHEKYPEEFLSYHWQNSIEAYFENNWKALGKQNSTKFGLGFFKECKPYKKRFNILRNTDTFLFQGFGNMITLDNKFWPEFEALIANTVSKEKLISLKKSFPKEMSTLPNLGFFTNAL